jgi:riboflavin synthase
MFTGLIEEIGTVGAIEDLGDSMRLTIRGPIVRGDAGLGDSIAVDGCCLTVTELDGDNFAADVMAESLARTALGRLAVGDRVNLERAMQAGARLGGHIVQGHVDGTAELLDRSPSQHWESLRFSLPVRLAHYLVDKGSITVSGVSLTAVEVGDDWFSVSLIPTTLGETTLGQLAPGAAVNLEVDIVAKYVERMLGKREDTHE